MIALSHLSAFCAAAALVIVIPGPATLFVLARAGISPQRAAWGVAGIVCGDVVLISLAALGVSALLTQWPALLHGLKLTGAYYLLYLGIGLWRAASGDAQGAPPPRAGRDFLKGLLLTLTNPKPILFFSAFFPLFIPAGETHYHLVFGVLGALFEVINLSYFAIICLLAIRTGRVAVRPWLSPQRLSQLGGLALLLCGGSMVWTTLR